MDRRAFILATGAGLLAAPLAAAAQQAEKVWQIGLLGPAGERVYTDVLLSLRAGLREFGYVEGKNMSLNTDSPRTSTNGSRVSRPNWFAARWTSSWRTQR